MLFKIIAVFVFLCFSCNLSLARMPLTGKCPDFSNCTDKNLNITASDLLDYQYLVSSVPFYFQDDYKCTWFNMTLLPDNRIFKEQFETNIHDNEIRYTYAYQNVSNSGLLFKKYTELELPMNSRIITLNSIYRIAISCFECGIFSKEEAGIYSFVTAKVPWLPCTVHDEIIARLESCGIPKKYVKIENQDGCVKCDKHKKSKNPHNEFH